MSSQNLTPEEENLQMLRFFAAALVLATHLTFYIKERVDSSFVIWHVGEAGVQIFFLISGVVMYLATVHTPRSFSGATYFLSRRIARVFPLYWLMTSIKVAFALVVPAAVLHNKPDFLHILGRVIN
jgi:exopolysaccharide production protein ExoZ